MVYTELSAFELCANYQDQKFKIKGGSIIWESISYKQNCDKCYISRIVKSGGKPFLLGLRYKCMYIKPETKLIVIT